MPHDFHSQDLTILPNRQGSERYGKSSHPLCFGRYTEVRTGQFVLHYNRQGQVKRISGTGNDWPHPAEWLKRTLGNHWVYYSTGNYYSGVFDLLGEYYLPCPDYPTNTLFAEEPFARSAVQAVQAALATAATMAERFSDLAAAADRLGVPPAVLDFLRLAARQTPRQLLAEAAALDRILGASVTVLPPDCRHVDYDVLPLIIGGGCLYNCGFCGVKSGAGFRERSREDIAAQLRALKGHLGDELANYNSLFLGQHDALAARAATILWAAEQGYELLEIGASCMQGPRLFLFGSVDSFLDKEDGFFLDLNRLPWYSHINLGLESFDEETLIRLRKPVSAVKVRQAFARVMDLNRRLSRVEISVNFVLGEELQAAHCAGLGRFLADGSANLTSKAIVYCSPLLGSTSRQALLDQFRAIKRQSRLETYLYLIQRL